MPFSTKERLRGFMSQYVIARAAGFGKSSQAEEAWDCMLQARTIFHALDKVADAEPEDQPSAQTNPIGAMVGQQARPWQIHRFDPANNYMTPEQRSVHGVFTEGDAPNELTQGTLAKLYKAAMGRIIPNDQKK